MRTFSSPHGGLPRDVTGMDVSHADERTFVEADAKPDTHVIRGE
jgi:hypothetical protein